MNSITPFKRAIESERIRKMDGGRIASVYDVIRELTGSKNPWMPWKRMIDEGLAELTKCEFFVTPYSKKPTPFADAPTMMEIIMVLPGKIARQVRQEAAKLMCRYLAGDPQLAVEVLERGNASREMLDAALDRILEQRARLRDLESVREDCAPCRPYGQISERTGLPMQQLVRAYWRSARKQANPPPWVQLVMFGHN